MYFVIFFLICLLCMSYILSDFVFYRYIRWSSVVILKMIEEDSSFRCRYNLMNHVTALVQQGVQHKSFMKKATYQ